MADQTPDGYSAPSLHGTPSGRRSPRGGSGRRSGPSRRTVLAGGGLVLAAAAAGVAAGVASDRSGAAGSTGPVQPDELRAAAAAERTLIAAVDAALTESSGPRRHTLRSIRADHVAHLAALEAAAAQVAGTSPPTASAPARSRPSGGPAALRTGEQRAAGAAAARALRLSGRDAALLASIAACEAAHAEWLA
jgi:hypothetical protein